jgi:cytochrome c
MDSFEFNKIAMAVLATVFGVFSVNIISDAIFHAEAPEQQAFVIAEGAGTEESTGSEPAGPAFEPVAPLLASADPAAGENLFRRCATCHTVEQGGQNKVGPNLWNVVNSPIAAHESFSYSTALEEYGEGKNWTYEELNGFIWKPKSYVRGTAMGFVGLADVEDRADVIAYLRSLADTPAPLPEPIAPIAQPEESREQPETADDQTGAETGDAGSPAVQESSGGTPAEPDTEQDTETVGEDAPAEEEDTQ